MGWRLYLDDDADTIRPPAATIENPRWRSEVGLAATGPVTEHLGPWVVARSAAEALAEIAARGVPDFISFDHDLGDGPSAMAVVNALIDMDLDDEVLPETFAYEVHSRNPPGRANISSKLDAYLAQRSARETRP